MRKAAIAQWMLSILVDPLRASAMVGDLLERSALSWVSVARIAASSVAADLRDRPGALAFLALRAFILQFGLVVLRSKLFPAQSEWDLMAGCLAVLWLVHRAPGRETAAWLALILMNVFTAASVAALSTGIKVEFPPATALYVIALFGIVVGERRRRFRHARS
jgi:hypothetical protein